MFVRCCIIQLYLPLFTLVCTLHRPECDPSDEFPTRGGAGGLTPQSFYTPLSTPLSNDHDADDDGGGGLSIVKDDNDVGDYDRGSCTYYVITFQGPERPLPPYVIL